MIQDSDFHVLISALAGMSEEIRQMFYRNVSQRVRERLVGEIVHKESIKTPENQVQAAQEHLLQLFQKWIDSDEESTMPKPDSLPPMPRLDTKKDIIETFKTLASFCRTYGFIVLEEYAGSIDHPVMKKGLEMIINGWGEMDWRPVLERQVKMYLQSIETKLNMIMDGLEALQANLNDSTCHDQASQEERTDIDMLIDTLPEIHRRLYRLYYEENRTVREISGLLDRPEGTVKYLLYALRKQLKMRMG